MAKQNNKQNLTLPQRREVQGGALVLRAENLLVQYAQRTVLDIPLLEVHAGDRIGLVGRNGEGKTTLMNLLSGDSDPQEGSVSQMAPLAYIPQFSPENTLTQSVLTRQRLQWGIPEQAMSGGEKTRLLIARALGRESGILLCDEPTSNLDARGINQLEEELLRYEGALVVISHDRALLDKLCSKIWELEKGKLRAFRGNWSDYRLQKERELQQARDDYEVYTEERAHLLSAVRIMKGRSTAALKPPSRMSNSEASLHKNKAAAQSKRLARAAKMIERRVERMDVKEKPRDEEKVRWNTRDTELPGGRFVLRVKGLRFSYGSKAILRGVDLELENGRHVALTGANGTGKTTLLERIAQGDAGVWTAPALKIGYFRQDLAVLNDEKTLLDNVCDTAAVPTETVRHMLSKVLLTAQSVQKKAGVLSGGEKCKAALVKLLASDANMLLLDEPTNFLDAYALEGLEELMNDFPGSILMVSHDRYFVNQTADEMWVMEDGRLRQPTYAAQDALKTEQQLSALRFRRDLLLARLSTTDDEKKRAELEAEYEQLEEDLRRGTAGGEGDGRSRG
ncbi:MAG: ABC-F family ATP-binding cassette domain-containing protein [Eubacteriales bacterium]|nr:ABC-F family ATP-binding cassette domain-containing protein [Eubacteriales bacterium]